MSPFHPAVRAVVVIENPVNPVVESVARIRAAIDEE
jgi:hypothetical protein